MPKKIAACVVLYNPSLQVVSNIKSYFPYIDYLIAIDNSENKNKALEESLHYNFRSITYIFQQENTGIAAALNLACTIAIAKGFTWLLTMDQDSSFLDNGLSKMIKDIDVIELRYNRVGIITPYHLLTKTFNEHFDEDYGVKTLAMTSGNLLNLKAYATVGLFDEKLFIDFVDYEYCLRLCKNDYAIIQNNHVKLKHALGNFQIKHFLGKRIEVTNHDYIRKYYRTRNSLFVAFKYLKTNPHFFLRVLFDTFVIIPFIILLYENNKLLKFKSIYNGILDFTRGKFGRKTISFEK